MAPALKRRIRWLFAVALVVFVGGACRAPDPPLRVGVLVWPPYDLAYLAVEREFVDRDDVRLVTFHSPSEVARSFRYGLLDAMFTTSHFVLSLAPDVDGVRIVYVIDSSRGGDVLLAKPRIDSPQDLAGRRVGVEAAPLGLYTLERALDRMGLDRDAVEIVAIDTAEHFRAWQEDRVDALVTYEPTRSQLKRLGAKELFSSRQIPDEILDVLVVRDDIIEARRERLEDLVEGLDRALAAYRADPAGTVSEMVQRHPISPAEFMLAMEGVELFDLADNVRLLGAADGRIAEALEKQCEVMVAAGMLERPPGLESVIDPSIVEQAAAR
ncbi:ABC transporter substrate-binding protein [Wenzhouxiangella sediminis]|uniref:ABC transporter substrate-binding protein n=1 Tax=Wenzhouxiangella sediminis TaxID=1792836 RepID=UPI0015F27CFC|nr:ABC transporter substrate-binding protein [Wenzhouxiangella sediminis]